MRTVLILAFACLIFFRAEAQLSLRGKIADNDEKPLEYARVSVKNMKDTTDIQDAITDKTGSFSFSLSKDDYELSVSYLGQSLLTKKISLSKNLNLGTLKIKTGNQIKSVTVSGKKPLIEQKIDRLVFNVENSIAASGGDALDALRVTPGLRLQNDKISIVGKSGLAVMINDRMLHLSGEDLTNYLRSLSSDDIKSIEVITTPPAKYEAEGNSGLINIVLKKTKKNSWSNSLRSHYSQTTYPIFGLGNTFNYRKNKLSVLASINQKKGNRGYFMKGKIYYPDRIWELDDYGKIKQDNLFAILGLDYDMSSKASIGFFYNGNFSYPDDIDQPLNNVFNLDNTLKSRIVSTGNNQVKNVNHALNTHYIQQLDTLGKKLVVNLDYFAYEKIQDRNFEANTFSPNENQTAFSSALNSNGQQIDNYSAKADVDYPTKWAKLSYGAKASFTTTHSEVKFFDTTGNELLPDLSQSNVFKYKENTQAIYASLSKSMGKKWQTKLGLRLENTQTKGIPKKGKVVRREYTQLFPSFYLLYQINKKNSLNMNYSRRIDRPGFFELDPFRFYINPTSYTNGNPFLQPSFTDDVELTHTYKNKLVSNIYLSVTSDGFGQIPTVNPKNDSLVYTRKNYYTLYSYGWSESYTLNPFSWWQSQNQTYLYYNETRLDKTTELGAPTQNGLAFYFSTNNSFTLNRKKTLSGEINFWYNSQEKSNIVKIGNAYKLRR